MKQLKLIMLLLLLNFGMQTSFSQVYKFQTTGYSVMEKNDKGIWGKWSDLQKVDLVVKLDTEKNRIIVYSQEIQLYDILSYEPKEESESDLIYPFTCKDIDGEKFTISIITRRDQGNRKQLYINQKDIIIVYNIINFPEGGSK
jgi:hypothetical protein